MPDASALVKKTHAQDPAYRPTRLVPSSTKTEASEQLRPPAAKRYAELVFPELAAAADARAATSTWYNDLTAWLAHAGQIAAALVAAGAVLGFAWTTYRKTLGRRRDRYGRLERLGTNAQISFFSYVLGEPPAIRRTHESTISTYEENGNRIIKPKTWTECIWVDRDFYVQVFGDEDETIQAYSVTTRSKHFKPRFQAPGGYAIARGRIGRFLRLSSIKLQPKIRLGKTRFHMLGLPQHAAAWTGAHNLHYFESYYLGNPGLYQTFVFSINDSGYGAYDHWDRRLHRFWLGFPNDAQCPSPQDESSTPSWYDAFRRQARINTYTVMTIALENYPFFTPPPQVFPTNFGPNDGIMRTIAPAKRRHK